MLVFFLSPFLFLLLFLLSFVCVCVCVCVFMCECVFNNVPNMCLSTVLLIKENPQFVTDMDRLQNQYALVWHSVSQTMLQPISNND